MGATHAQYQDAGGRKRYHLGPSRNRLRGVKVADGNRPAEGGIAEMTFGKKGRAQEKAVEALSEARVMHQELMAVQKQLKRQQLLVQALWELLKRRLDLEEEVLKQTVDGLEAAERESAAKTELCPSCGRALQKTNRQLCIYCGERVEQKDVF
jgi:hypothetical protein